MLAAGFWAVIDCPVQVPLIGESHLQEMHGTFGFLNFRHRKEPEVSLAIFIKMYLDYLMSE